MGNRQIIAFGVATALLLPLRAMAGEISGTLVEAGRPLTGIDVTLKCANRPAVPTRTDNFGRYRLEVPGATGRCTLTIAGAQQAEVFVLASPARYDFERIGRELRRR
ncbi:MAG TPA: hypothetical protein VMH26_02915 [Burkholderiales bacterium]|nr:hypothetical protein [Burkholderiales bacterium]